MTRFNLDGWNWKEWLYGNKEILKVVIPGLIGLAVTKNWIDAGLAGIISKPILDVIEYYIKK